MLERYIDQTSTQEEFIAYLNKWYFWATHSRLDPMIKVAKTIKRHWDGVVRWYESKINNGIREGLNSVIQAAKSKARGYRTFIAALFFKGKNQSSDAGIFCSASLTLL